MSQLLFHPQITWTDYNSNSGNQLDEFRELARILTILIELWMGHAEPAVSAQSTFIVCRELQIWKVPFRGFIWVLFIVWQLQEGMKNVWNIFSKIFQLTKMAWLKRIMNKSFSNVVIHLCTQRPTSSHSVNILLLLCRICSS